jgi:transcriptional regulator with XRE-family HTH domain
MSDLRTRFGTLVAAHRKRHGWTQAELAEHAELSEDMISRMESGATGARFPTIERLADALGIDPAELFTSELPEGALQRARLSDITARLAKLSDADLEWINGVIWAAMDRR